MIHNVVCVRDSFLCLLKNLKSWILAPFYLPMHLLLQYIKLKWGEVWKITRNALEYSCIGGQMLASSEFTLSNSG